MTVPARKIMPVYTPTSSLLLLFFSDLAILWKIYLGVLFFLCHYIPNAPVKRTFILEPLISKLCCLHWSTRFPFFLGEREVPRHTIHIPSTPLPSLDRGFSAPCLGLRRAAQGPWLREHKGKMGSFAFSLLGQYPKNDCTVDF